MNWANLQPQGQGPLVVLLHGLGGDRQHWGELPRYLLDQGYQVSVPDLPGHGATPLGIGPLEASKLGQQLAQWLPEGAILIGNSLGGWISLWAYLQAPTKVRALILVAPAGLQGMITRLPKLRLDKQSLELQLAQTLFAHPEQLDPQLVASIVRSLKTPAPALNQIAPFGQFTPMQLGQVRAPVLLVWGLADQLIPMTWADEFSQYLPQSHTVLIPNCGHLPQLECATLFQAQLSSFLGSIAEINTGRHHSTKQ